MLLQTRYVVLVTHRLFVSFFMLVGSRRLFLFDDCLVSAHPNVLGFMFDVGLLYPIYSS